MQKEFSKVNHEIRKEWIQKESKVNQELPNYKEMTKKKWFKGINTEGVFQIVCKVTMKYPIVRR